MQFGQRIKCFKCLYWNFGVHSVYYIGPFGMTDECGHVALAIGDLHWFSLALTGSHPVLAYVSSLVFMTLQWWTSMVNLNGPNWLCDQFFWGLTGSAYWLC